MSKSVYGGVYHRSIIPKFILQIASDILVFLGQNLPHPKLRILIWKLRGARLHKVKYIGMNCLIGNHPWLLTIRKNAVISSGTRILTEDYSYQNVGGRRYSAPVVLEENVHIGMNCVILPGVTIGKDSVVGSGAVVMSSIPAGVVATGNPAKAIMSVKLGKEMLESKLNRQKGKQK